MLTEFQTIRNALEQCEFQRKSRLLTGRLLVTAENLGVLIRLQDGGYIEASLKDGRSVAYLPDAQGHLILVALNPRSLYYFEDTADLVAYTAEEPSAYYVHGIGEVVQGSNEGNAHHPAIVAYRQMLRARKLLRMTADSEDSGKAVFLTPEKIEIPLKYSSGEIPPLPHLAELESQFEKRHDKDPGDRDQRLVLFRKSLREYLKAHPPEGRFELFLRNFETIFESYTRDYQLWVGNTFGELEKSFEEKRLKFVADLNGILAGVQASILAVPIATILLGDKYDLANPLKNFLLAVAVLLLGVIALKLLENQSHTLDATRKAIDATKSDFEQKHTRRKEEFETRLKNLDEQEGRVRILLKSMRQTIIGIVILGFVAWAVSFFRAPSASTLLNSIRPSPTTTAPSAVDSPERTQSLPNTVQPVNPAPGSAPTSAGSETSRMSSPSATPTNQLLKSKL
ncbi:MAG: hypothetical protein EB141_02090 [Verrucomicrobia bacterium]|nr:hypothetical protein [Verrucomicrobiota bacterium]NBU10421.1 hypothetical protein [Pseudomonadota bacterium]NDA65636.1 hypothetical protein [Verrucomicrobiota bacterium]NDB74435.1 hypothetical protein [Verrucomicrobiota bacterium]NDD37515.1 hypothetical protein [Verrucomicrobiota bacterium]